MDHGGTQSSYSECIFHLLSGNLRSLHARLSIFQHSFCVFGSFHGVEDDRSPGRTNESRIGNLSGRNCAVHYPHSTYRISKRKPYLTRVSLTISRRHIAHLQRNGLGNQRRVGSPSLLPCFVRAELSSSAFFFRCPGGELRSDQVCLSTRSHGCTGFP